MALVASKFCGSTNRLFELAHIFSNLGHGDLFTNIVYFPSGGIMPFRFKPYEPMRIAGFFSVELGRFFRLLVASRICDKLQPKLIVNMSYSVHTVYIAACE